jgi:hypothetical protein
MCLRMLTRSHEHATNCWGLLPPDQKIWMASNRKKSLQTIVRSIECEYRTPKLPTASASLTQPRQDGGNGPDEKPTPEAQRMISEPMRPRAPTCLRHLPCNPCNAHQHHTSTRDYEQHKNGKATPKHRYFQNFRGPPLHYEMRLRAETTISRTARRKVGAHSSQMRRRSDCSRARRKQRSYSAERYALPKAVTTTATCHTKSLAMQGACPLPSLEVLGFEISEIRLARFEILQENPGLKG